RGTVSGGDGGVDLRRDHRPAHRPHASLSARPIWPDPLTRPGGSPMPDDDLEAIREGVRRVCSKFDDAYWRSHDADHEFPWDFYNLMAEGGWVGIAIPEEWGGG